MKTILLSIMVSLSYNIYSQNGIEKFESQVKDLRWKTFKKLNKVKKTKIIDGGVRRVTLDASLIDDVGHRPESLLSMGQRIRSHGPRPHARAG